MNITCLPGTLSGTVKAIPSKSDAHRKLICAALSENGGFIPLRAPFCDDVAATVRCLRALGAEITETPEGVQISPLRRQASALLDCGESGSTLRFLLPTASAVCSDISVTGSGRLPQRPITVLVQQMSAHGVRFSAEQLPLRAKGALTGGLYEIPGNISSQFLSGLLFALSQTEAGGAVRLTTPLQSSAYADMTVSTLCEFGADIRINTTNSGLPAYCVAPGPLRTPEEVSVDGDWSNAAFWLVAGALQSGAAVTVSGVYADSVQGDKAVTEILRKCGAKLRQTKDSCTVSGGNLNAAEISVAEIPDLLPILAVFAANAEGVTHFTDAARLRLKESDRLTAVRVMLEALGGRAEESEDSLTVYGTGLLGGTVDAQNDHRLVMAAAIAALICKNPVGILGAEAVNKSYPQFFSDFAVLGGRTIYDCNCLP